MSISFEKVVTKSSNFLRLLVVLAYSLRSVVYNRVFWHTLGWAQNNNYKNEIKKIIPLKLTKILIILIFKVLSNN